MYWGSPSERKRLLSFRFTKQMYVDGWDAVYLQKKYSVWCCAANKQHTRLWYQFNLFHAVATTKTSTDCCYEGGRQALSHFHLPKLLNLLEVTENVLINTFCRTSKEASRLEGRHMQWAKLKHTHLYKLWNLTQQNKYWNASANKTYGNTHIKLPSFRDACKGTRRMLSPSEASRNNLKQLAVAWVFTITTDSRSLASCAVQLLICWWGTI